MYFLMINSSAIFEGAKTDGKIRWANLQVKVEIALINYTLIWNLRGCRMLKIK